VTFSPFSSRSPKTLLIGLSSDHRSWIACRPPDSLFHSPGFEYIVLLLCILIFYSFHSILLPFLSISGSPEIVQDNTKLYKVISIKFILLFVLLKLYDRIDFKQLDSRAPSEFENRLSIIHAYFL
jgi:hypothetical protein